MTTTTPTAVQTSRTHCGLCERGFEPGVTAYLCHGCMCRTGERLDELPALYRLAEIELTPSMAASFEPRVSGGSVEAPLPLNEDVAELRGDLVLGLEAWRAALYEAMGWGRPEPCGRAVARVTAAAGSLRAHLLWIAQDWELAGKFAAAVRDGHGGIESVVAPRPKPKRLGQCVAKVGDHACGAFVTLPAGAAVARCRWCRAEYPPTTWLKLLTAAQARGREAS